MTSTKKGKYEDQISEKNEKDDSSEEMFDTESEKIGNRKWAKAMSKILQTDKPKRKKSLVLSKAKKLCDIVNEPKEEPLPFEIEKEGEFVRETIKKDPEESIKKEKKVKDTLSIRKKPDILDRERERTLQKIATK